MVKRLSETDPLQDQLLTKISGVKLCDRTAVLTDLISRFTWIYLTKCLVRTACSAVVQDECRKKNAHAEIHISVWCYLGVRAQSRFPCDLGGEPTMRNLCSIPCLLDTRLLSWFMQLVKMKTAHSKLLSENIAEANRSYVWKCNIPVANCMLKKISSE